MLFIAYTIGLIVSLVLVYMAGKRGIYWLQILLVLAITIGTAIGAGNLGIEIGKSLSESQFYSGPRRTLGMAFHQMSGEGKRGETEVLIEKVDHLSSLWNKTKFFEEDGGDSLTELYLPLLDTGKVQPGEVVNASSPAGLSENHLHD